MYLQSSLLVAILFQLLVTPSGILAATYPLPPIDTGLIGQIESAITQKKSTLLDIAVEYDIGQNEILLANPKIDRWLPIEGSRAIIPSRYILPRGERAGIVINLPEMRLYYFPQTTDGYMTETITYPVSIGRMDWNTPHGAIQIASKTENPGWTPPKSIIEEARVDGEELPVYIPPGPDNPLGQYAMRLSLPGYLIHGTNKTFGIGMRVTHGCVRMHPDDIAELFPQVPLKTAVNIVNQPIKTGWLANTLFMEVHPPLEEDKVAFDQLLESAIARVKADATLRDVVIDEAAILKAVQQQQGIPVAVGRVNE